jgi:3-dehydroquinate synthase
MVLSDPDVLASLPPDARRDGLAEVIKTALIGEPDLFSILEKEGASLLDFDNPLLETVIAKACAVKCRVVGQDEQEAGYRRILNFGHTLGHAVEAASNYTISHGQAVAAGMGIAIKFSQKWLGLDKDDATRGLALIHKLGLPVDLPRDVDPEPLLSALAKDKKIQQGICHFVLISEIGQAVIYPIPVEELRRSLKEIAN